MNTSKELKSCGALLAIAAGALVFATPTLALDLVRPDVTVPYSDLDIDSVDGATVLLKRIKVASESVCAPLYHGDLGSRRKYIQCQQQSTAAGVAKVGSPVLASVYKSVYPTAPPVAAASR